MASSLGSGEVETDKGIIQGHSYSIISIHEFRYKGSYERLLKLRNPWGHGEWRGDWSENDPRWTSALED